MKTEIQLPKAMAAVLMQNMVNKHHLWQRINLNNSSVLNTIEEGGEITSVVFKNVQGKTISLHNDGTLQVMQEIADDHLVATVSRLIAPLNCDLSEVTDLSLCTGNIPLSSVPIMPVMNSSNAHIFSKYADVNRYNYCGVAVETAPFQFGALINLHRDTINEELAETGYFSNKDTFTGTYNFTKFYFKDIVNNNQITLNCTKHKPEDVYILRHKPMQDMFTITYTAETDVDGYDNERAFMLIVNEHQVRVNVSAEGTLNLSEGQMFVDGEVEVLDAWDKTGKALDIYSDEFNVLVKYFDDNFKLVGYSVDIKRNCNYRNTEEPHKLSGAARDVLNKLVMYGSLDDGDLPSKSGMSELINLGLAKKDYSQKLPNMITEKGIFTQRPVGAIKEPTDVKEKQEWSTPLVPIKTEANAGMFSVSALPDMVLLDGSVITTPPFAFSRKFDLLAITQTDALLDNGYLNRNDSIRADVKISSIFISTSIGVIELKRNTPQLTVTDFTGFSQNQIETAMEEVFTSTLLLKDVVKKSRFDRLDYETAKISLLFSIYFRVQNETGSVSTLLRDVIVSSLTDVNGNVLPLNDTEKQIIREKISFAGYYISGYRVNNSEPIGN